jgi:hypothetical protein
MMAQVYVPIVKENCPFCGSGSLEVEESKDLGLVRGSHQWSSSFVWCNNCGTRGPQKDTVKAAKEAWDNRALLK